MLKKISFTLLSLVALTTSTTTLAADPPSAETEFVQAAPATPEKEGGNATVKQQSINTRPLDDNHADYRYCLEYKTNLEIMHCRYKKR